MGAGQRGSDETKKLRPRARLQGLGQLCRACRRRMEGTTWELFVRLLLAEQ
jgi:hypothetical protein